MYDLGTKTYLNLLIPSSSEPEETDNKSGGLLSRSKPMPNKSMPQENNEIMKIAKIVSNIRSKRKAITNG